MNPTQSTRAVVVAGIAYHIDKTCTGGTDEDFIAAEAIHDEFVAPLREVLAEVYDAAVGVCDITNPDLQRDRQRLSLLLDKVEPHLPRGER